MQILHTIKRIWPTKPLKTVGLGSVPGTQVLCKTWEVVQGKDLLPHISLQTSSIYSYFNEHCIVPNIATLP